MIWVVSTLLSFLIFTTILSWGFLSALIYLFADVGVARIVMPIVGKYVPKICSNEASEMASLGLKLVFYSVIRGITEPSQIYMYIIGYSITHLSITAATSFMFCK